MTTIRHVLSAAVPFALVLAATSARADEPSATSSYAECASTKVTAASANAAHGAFVAGKASFDAGDYPTALTYLKDAYRRDCRKIDLLLLIARSYELLGASGAAVAPGSNGPRRSEPKREAARALEAYLQRAPADSTEAATQRERADRLMAEAARLDAEDAEAAAKRAAAQAQAQTVTAVAPVAPGSTAIGTAPPAEERSHTALPWVVAGIGVAGVAAGAVLFAVGHGRESDASDACPTMTACSPDVTSKGNSGAHEKNAGIGLLAGGAAALVGGLVWHIVEPTGPRESAATTAFELQPVIAPASPFAVAASPSLAGVAIGAHGTF